MGEDSGSDAPWGIVSIKAQDVGAYGYDLCSIGTLPDSLTCISCNARPLIPTAFGFDADSELPMQPITVMRNALGKDQGGSGVAIDPEAYMASVKYWSAHAPIQ